MIYIVYLMKIEGLNCDKKLYSKFFKYIETE